MLKAYAKINLGLFVRDRRPDGYHNIESVFHRIDLFDEITFGPAHDITVYSSAAEVPGDESNLCYRAALLLRQHLRLAAGVAITLVKKIPVGAGLGGGSSDAAITLQALPRFWGQAVEGPALRLLALELGSDVPFFLGQGSAVGRGRGELLDYFHLDIPFTILLCNPNLHISTAWAYQQIHLDKARPTIDIREVVIKGMKDPSRLAARLGNDFEPAVFAAHPEIRRVKEAMIDGGAVFALMSGSGSSVYGLFEGAEEARRVSASFAANGYRTFLTRPHFSPEERGS